MVLKEMSLYMIKGRLKRKLYFSLCSMLSAINRLVYKRQNTILFFSTTTLYDNSEALFHYLITQGYNQKYRITCVVRYPNTYQNKYFNVRYISVFHAIWPILRAKYVFYHNEMLAIMPSNDQIFVDFWHASTFKKINKMIDPNYKYDFFTYLTVTSEIFRPIFSQAFGCDDKRIIINGHPRDDYLFKYNNVLKDLGIFRHYEKYFIWVPTYRLSQNHHQQDTAYEYFKGSGLPVFYTEESLKDLNHFLVKNNSFMIIKIHPAQDSGLITNKRFTHIRFLYNSELEEKNIPFYSILPYMDALITDYSSIMFDYLLLDRPMAFTIDDMEDYNTRRGFVFQNPFDFMPGEYISQPEEFYSFLNHCINNQDDYKLLRSKINNLVNYYKDGNNCRRILEFIGISKNND